MVGAETSNMENGRNSYASNYRLADMQLFAYKIHRRSRLHELRFLVVPDTNRDGHFFATSIIYRQDLRCYA